MMLYKSILFYWINSIKSFLQDFENLLKQGTQVYIGYGLGQDNNNNHYQADIHAKQKIQLLARKYKNNFQLKRLGDTHAKILISE